MENQLVPYLDLTKTHIRDVKVSVHYCVTAEVHDANVRASIKRGYKSIPAATETTYDPIAIVCSGPSLKQEWEEIKKFSKIITVSGAHDFLIERGIIPTYHMEADPRAHKSVFVKNPNAAVKYLIASCCHKQVFDNLEGHDVMLWHILGSEVMRKTPAIYPRGHWVLTGGSNVGLRALVMARLLGHLNIHVFGMDCSSEENFHANAHPNEPKEKSFRKVVLQSPNGPLEFRTTEVFLEYARQFFKETAQIADAQVALHGNGLLQNLAAEMLADPVRRKERELEVQRIAKSQPMIAIVSPEVISDVYIDLNKKLHEERPDYGVGGAKHAHVVNELYTKSKAKIDSVLDYGCGKGMLARALPYPIWEYDPAIPGKDGVPRPADLVVCTDVLEHIEPEYLENVLSELARCTLKIGYLVIHTGAASKVLEDGRNAHLLQHGPKWWDEKLSKYFILGHGAIKKKGQLLHIVVIPKNKYVT